MRATALRWIILLDAAVLILLGLLLLFLPTRVTQFFRFADAPENFRYLIGLWGCALLTMAGGYVAAAMNPWKHRLWIQIGIVRGGMEAILGLVCMTKGTVTFQQAGLGTVASALICIAYLLFYPRPTKEIQ